MIGAPRGRAVPEPDTDNNVFCRLERDLGNVELGGHASHPCAPYVLLLGRQTLRPARAGAPLLPRRTTMDLAHGDLLVARYWLLRGMLEEGAVSLL